MKNEYKKQDSEGNPLPEQIGKGIDVEHEKKVLKERLNDASITFKLPSKLKTQWEDLVGKNQSHILRLFIKDVVENEDVNI